MERDHVTDEDQGKPVVDSHGEKIGMISGVESGKAHVKTDPGMADSIRSKLGWNDADQEDYPLEMDRIHTVTDDEVRLKDM